MSSISTELEDEFYNKICFDNDPDNISRLLKEPKALNMISKIQSFSANKLKRSLKLIHKQVNHWSVYDTKHRIYTFLIHEEFTRRGIAPVWRGIPKFKLPKKNSPKAHYLADLQIFDLSWVDTQYRGLNTQDGEWGGLFEDIFSSPEFNYDKAYQISRSQLTNEKKILPLSLNDAIQEDLLVLRSGKISKRMFRLMKQAVKVEISLNEAGIRFPKRKRTADQINVCKDAWIASQLSNGSVAEAQRKFRQITGETINSSTYRSKLKSVEDTLAVVNFSNAA